jgi:hypothetical protein
MFTGADTDIMRTAVVWVTCSEIEHACDGILFKQGSLAAAENLKINVSVIDIR